MKPAILVLLLVGLISILLVLQEETKRNVTMLVKKDGTTWITKIEGVKVLPYKATLMDYKDTKITYIKEK